MISRNLFESVLTDISSSTQLIGSVLLADVFSNHNE